MKRISFIFFAAILLLTMPQITLGVKYAWWLLITYEPETNQIESIPVAVIDPSWSLAEALSKEAIPPEEMIDFQKNYEPYGYSFSKAGDFNLDGKRDKALVGIYQDKSGGVGRFLLILTESQKNKWVKSFLYKYPGKAGFSILRLKDGKLGWYFCLDCDDFSSIEWENGKYVVFPFHLK